MAKGGLVTKLGKAAVAGEALKRTARKAQDKVEQVPPPSPNPLTNLVIADIALRGGSRILRNVVETGLLGKKYPTDKARNIVAGRGIVQTMIGAAAARLATRSVPGAILVGGGMLAKTLYDRKKGREAKLKGEAALDKQAEKGTEVRHP